MTLVPARGEILVAGEWLDLAGAEQGILTRDAITITRGRPNEASRLSPAAAAFSIRNANGWASPDNPASPYYGLLGRNMPVRLSVEAPNEVLDTFTRNTVDGWGTSDVGHVWDPANTADSDYSCNGTTGRHSNGTLNQSRFTLMDLLRDPDLTVTVSTPVLATGAPHRGGLVVRADDELPGNAAGNNYSAWLVFNTDQTVHLQILKTETGVATSLGTDTTTGLTHTAGGQFKIRFQANGPQLKAKCWAAAAAEPDAWNLEVSDSTFLVAASYGCRSRIDAGNTNPLPVVVSFDNLESVNWRFFGEASELPPRWDLSGTDVWVPMRAAGLLRRLNAGKAPLRSALTRGTLATEGLVEYWPMEEERLATRFAPTIGTGHLSGSGFTPGTGLEVGDSGTEAGLSGTVPVAVIHAGARLSAAISSPGPAGAWTMRELVYIEEPAINARIFQWHTTGTAQGWHLRIEPATDTLRLEAFDALNNTLLSNNIAFGSELLYHRWVMIEVAATQNGANIDYHVMLRFPDRVESGVTGTLNSHTAGVPASVVLIGDAEFRVGHISVTSVNEGFFIDPAIGELLNGRAGETAVDRIGRLCAEESVPLVVIGDAADSEVLGAQRSATLLELIHDAAKADQGLIFEPRDRLAIGYRTRRSLYNQAPAVALDYGQLRELDPTPDDSVRNDITVQRFDGSRARAVQQTGPLNVQEPADDPNGVGRYDEELRLNVEEDERLPHIAAWRRHLGTWRPPRYPRIVVRPPGANPTLAAALAAVRQGDVITVDNLPVFLPPALVEALVEGVVETLEDANWWFEFHAAPAGPYTVGVYGTSRYAPTGSVLAEALDTTETGVDVDTSAGRWTTSVGAGFPIVIGGEVMNVTGIAAAVGANQTFTVTRNIQGIPGGKTHAIGAPVELYLPARYAL